MEAEPIVLPDNTVIDTSIPPPGYNFPKPDFSAVATDDIEVPPVAEKNETPVTKPTFKNALQAKKRLQAFSTNRPGSLPSSPSAKKLKPNLNTEEKLEESPVKKTLKKSNYHDDKAKAVIEEIEELKREEFLRYTPRKARSESHSRSRSRSPNKERFKKVDKKARNYRRRSPTPEKPKKTHKKTKKYPKNWHEFGEFDSDFDLNREFDVPSPKGNNEVLRQILFESPSLPITQFKMKTVKNEEKIVPFDYIRYTRTKPVLAYSVNCVAIQDKFVSRKLILDSLPRDVVANIINLYSNSLKFKIDSNVKMKARNWFPKVWKDSDNENECKLLEKSVGLSFLQTYTGEEEENEFVEEEEKRVEEKEKEKRSKEKKEKEEKRAEEKVEKEEKGAEEKKEKEEKRAEEKIEKEEKRAEEKKDKDEKRAEEKKEKEEKRALERKDKEGKRAEDKKDKEEKRAEEKKDKEDKEVEERKERTEDPKSEIKAKAKMDKEENKKKKKSKKTELVEENIDSVVEKKKKKKRGNKDKKRHVDENTDQSTVKKKKRKKDKSKKKEKRSKDKKSKHKKASKEKKKKEKTPQEEEKFIEKPIEKLDEKPEKPSKQQVIEELRKIEEKLAKKREQEKAKLIEKKAEKEEKHDKEKGRKRKHSEREEIAKKAKSEKHKQETDLVSSEIKAESASKKKKVEIETKLDEKSKKHLDKRRSRSTEEVRKNDHRKSKSFEEIPQKSRPKKSRWSEPVKKEELDYPAKMDIAEEIKRIDEVIKKHEDLARGEDLNQMEETQKNEEMVKERTPDTDEYHSHWESDDDISSSVRRRSLKLNRSWESDEELFERTYNRNKTQSQSYADLEIPLNIKNFSRRTKWDEKPDSYVDTITEFKLLEEERKNLSEERKKLEIEKQRILQLQEEAKLDVDEKKTPTEEPLKEKVRMRSSTPEVELVKVKKEKCDVLDFNIDSLNNSILSNVSSTESNYPIAILENEYEEFIKAVSSESALPTKKKERRTSKDSTSSSSSSSDSDHKKKKRKKKKKKRKKRECEGLTLGKGNNIFNEFDIPVPSDLPEMVPTPVPVPSPIETILPLTPSSLLLNSIIEIAEKPVVEEAKEPPLNLTKPFVFSSIVLPSKKNPLLDNSNLKLDDSDSADFTDKFVKKVDEIEAKPLEKIEEQGAEVEIAPEVEVKQAEVALDQIELPKERPVEEIAKIPEPETKKVVEVVKMAEEKPKLPETKEKELKSGDGEVKIKRSISPERTFKERKRSRTRSREREPRRRSPIRRRDPSPPRRRFSSPRRRSPPRRRGSPRRRSPSPRRRSPSPRRRLSPLRRRRRSPSLSPPRSRGGLRKRTPSPRRRTSPLNSPLDGFKRSVADSTISDDMLPQPTPEDYVESPPSYREGKYYDRKKRGSLSPQNSPKRIPLDDRISLVLGLEKNEPPPPPPKPPETYANYNYGAYNQQYNQYPQYNQFVTPKNEYVAPFATPVFTQPPPPIVKPTPTKVVQVGNILQVVPNEEISQTIVETKPRETPQKIVQVGNMLQIVPAIMTTPTKVPVVVEPPPPPAPKPVPMPMPEKQSAEAVMKQKIAERKAERERRRQERERRRKEKEKKRKEKEKRKQMKLKIKTENMIKRAIQLEAEALASEDIEEEGENPEIPVQWPPVPVVISTTPSGKGILLGEGSSRKRKSVQFADGVRPGEGTSPSGGEELSSPPPNPPRLPKEKRYKKVKIPKKSKKKKIKVKVVKKKVQNLDEGDDDDEDDNLPPPSPPPGSPPPHVFPSRVKTHTINNVHQYVGNIIPTSAAGFPFRPPMPVVINRHQPPPGYMQGAYHSDVGSLAHPAYQGVPSHH